MVRELPETLKYDDPNDLGFQKLLDGLEDVTARFGCVILIYDRKDEEKISSLMQSIDDKNGHSTYIALLKIVSKLQLLQKNGPERNFTNFNGIMVDSGAN